MYRVGAGRPLSAAGMPSPLWAGELALLFGSGILMGTDFEVSRGAVAIH